MFDVYINDYSSYTYYMINTLVFNSIHVQDTDTFFIDLIVFSFLNNSSFNEKNFIKMITKVNDYCKTI